MEKIIGARVAGVFLLGASLLVGGCGYKNSPVPPEYVVPEAINDLLYTVNEKGVQLTWSYPVKNVIGAAIDGVDRFDLYRAVVPVEEYCGTCPIPFSEPIDVDGGASIDGKIRQKATYESSLLRSGHKYFFKVQSRTSWLAASADSNIVSFIWFQPVAPPQNLVTEPGDREISLSWQPVSTHLDGTAVENPVKYQVLRSDGGKDYVKIGEPLDGLSYVDQQVLNSKKYFYTIQSMMDYKGEFVEGGVSKAVSSTPLDLTPPLVPTGVTAVRTDVGIKIFWDKSSEDDIGAYRVYRRDADRDDYQMIGKVEPQYTLFVDAKASDNKRYYYAVTAFDTTTPPNESGKSREATIRY